MKLNQIVITAAVPCLLLPSLASATILTVAATDNISASGLSSANNVDPAGNGGGTLPLQINVTAGAYQFQYVSGHVTPDINFPAYNLDANGVPNQYTDISSYGGISGYQSDRGFALVGVFLGSGAPSAPAPSTIDFTTSTGIGSDFLSLSPEIGQVFLIGDGTTSLDQLRTYYVPTGATELYLGFADGYNFSGPPGQFADNSGSVDMNVTTAPVPEPAPMALMLAASALTALFRFRNKC